MRAEQVSSWQKGTEGEDRFEAALEANAVTSQWFGWYRNTRMRMHQHDLWALGSDLTVEQYEAKFNTHGDLDFIVIGPTGVHLIDVKNLSHESSSAELEKMHQGMVLQRDFLAIKLRAFYDSPIRCGFVMAGHQSQWDSIGDFPVHSIKDGLKAIVEQGTPMDPRKSWELYRNAGTVLEPNR